MAIKTNKNIIQPKFQIKLFCLKIRSRKKTFQKYMQLSFDSLDGMHEQSVFYLIID